MEHKAYDLRKMKEISGGDNTFINEMVVAFVENVSNAIDKIQTLKLTEDWKSIGEIAHKLASNFAYMSADDMYSIADNIEKSVLIEHNLTNIKDKTEKLCNESILLLNQIKNDFDFNLVEV